MTNPANAHKKQTSQHLGGLWVEKGLNPKLMARIRPVVESRDESGQSSYGIDQAEPEVIALFEDGEFAIEAQYSTPFESSNPEGRLPNLMGMIQSGQGVAAITALKAATVGGDLGAAAVNAVSAGAEMLGVSGAITAANDQLMGLMNRSNFTKLNSRQIYTSSNSVRITGTLVLQAWSDAKVEVEAVMQKLQEWASPKELSKNSLLVGIATEGFSEGLFPSVIPPLVQLQYGGCTYSPLFIESISAPMTAPMTPDGSRIAVRAQITLLSLAAWDKNDIANLRR